MIFKATHEPIRNIITIGSGIIEDAITSNEKCNIRMSNRNYSLFALHREDDFWKEISIMEKIDFFCIDFLGAVCNKNEKEDSPLSWDDQKLNNEITLLLDTIQNSAIWGKTRLVMLDARFPYQKTMDNCIFNIPDANYIAKVNSFLEKC